MIQKTPSDNIFRKTGSPPKKKSISVSPQQKALLIGKANAILNNGNIETAYKIFSSLSFYDGLMRVSRAYYKKHLYLRAYLVARQAGAHRDADTLGKSIGQALRIWLRQEKIQGPNKKTVQAFAEKNRLNPKPQS